MDIVSSWAGICPGNNGSAGKNRSNRSTGGNRWLRGALTECAWAAAAKKNCFLKEKFWRITSQISQQEELRASSCGSHHHATGLRSPPHRTTIPPPPGPGPLRPTEGPLDPPPRPQDWANLEVRVYSLSAGAGSQKGTIGELIETGRRVYFRKNLSDLPRGREKEILVTAQVKAN